MIGRFNPDIDDYEYDDDGPYCDVCGCELDWEHCWYCGGEGYFDEYDYDTINYAPGQELTPCPECHGTGNLDYCPNARHHAEIEAEAGHAQP